MEKQNGIGVSTNKFLWCGVELCEQRDSGGSTVTKRFFVQGEQIAGTSYFFTRDHLRNIREMVDGTGSLRARYDYDPYGRRTKIAGDLDSDFGFTEHYFHALSGMCLTLFRAYDANTGRWLSRDPLGEKEGINLYAYVLGDPLNLLDPLGLSFWSAAGCFGIGVLTGLLTGAAIAGAAALIGVVAPGLATVGLLVVAGVGAWSTLSSIGTNLGSDQPSWDKLAYDLGGIVGGLAVGLGTKGFRPGTPEGAWSLGKDASQGFKWLPGKGLGGNIGGWFGTGPNAGSWTLGIGAGGTVGTQVASGGGPCQ